jgi:hypothetical protein
MTFEDRQRVTMLDAHRSSWRWADYGHQPRGGDGPIGSPPNQGSGGQWRPTWAQPAERRLYEIEQACDEARATQRALLDHAKSGQLAPPDEGPDPLGR